MSALNINSERMKQNNVSVVLNMIRRHGQISRKDIAELTGLTAASITNIVHECIKAGLLMELGEGTSGGGRKPIMIGLNPLARYVVGIELNVVNIVCIITDFKARIIFEARHPTNIEDGKDTVLKRMLAFVDECIVKSSVDRSKLLGIGIATAGPYNHRKGMMVNPPNFKGWENVPIRDIIGEYFGMPCIFYKDTTAFTFAEYWLGQAEKAQSIFGVSVHEIGIGGGMIIDGKPFHGFCDGSGDFGHMMLEPDGRLCSCGSQGCLEACANAPAILEEVHANGDQTHTDIKSVAKAAIQGDPLCRTALNHSAQRIGRGIANVINIFSPEVIIVGGDVVEMDPLYFQNVEQTAREKKYPLYNKSVRIIPPTFGSKQNPVGAVCLVLQDFFEGLNTLS